MTHETSFSIEKSDDRSDARAGLLELPRGEIPTPAFMPVGTQGTVKGVMPRDLREVVKARIVLGNTYHLRLRPGPEIMRARGGLSKFMNWNGPILTDSGGFQVFSLPNLRKLTDEGVAFKSHLDGSELFLGPRESIKMQDALASDIAMCLDECPPADASKAEVEEAVRRTTLWAKVCSDAWQETSGPTEGRNLFGIVQGGRFEDLRRRSADELLALDFPGYATGGVSVGETEEEMLEQVAWCAPLLPVAKPRYVMGVGTPPQLLKMVALGADMFDCVMPTRAARHATAFTNEGRLNLRNERFREDDSALDEETDCFASREFSRAYLRHLVTVGESLGGVLLSLHNLRFFVSLLEQARLHIISGDFEQWSKNWIERYERSNSHG
ncbi:tRNA guanosine(34) transglycosylase Tgt [Opitutales bacterium]|jgi:queuine tRNA-ribosyltransferase|nr:tRNA guanosine(34) transglycosylase Tgt [Opitutales bacterium]